MAVLVTGGAGFIGSHVAEALVARGEDVVVLDDLSSGKRENLPDGVELVEGDVREPQDELFAGVKPTVCYHLAAQIDVRVSVARPDHDAQINVLGTVNLLQASLEHGTQVVFSSTGGAIYGECDGPAPRTRRACRSRRTGRRSSRRRSTWRRTTGSTGHGTSRCGTETCTARGKTPTAKLESSRSSSARCSQTRRRRCSATAPRPATTCTSATSPARPWPQPGRDGGVYNVGTGRETSVVELLDLCQRIAGTRFDATFMPPRPGEIQRSVLDPSRAVDELGWRAEHSLEDGLRETYEFFRG